MGTEDKGSYESAAQALKTHLDPGAKMLVAQGFHHASRKDSESVG